MVIEFWDQVVEFRFLVVFSLVLLGFLPMVISIYRTWMSDKE